MKKEDLASLDHPMDDWSVRQAPLDTYISRTDLEGILHKTNPQTVATELAIVDLMQNELRGFESALHTRLDMILSEVYHNNIPRPGIPAFKKNVKHFLKEYGHNLAYLAALNVDLNSPEAAAHFYNGKSTGKGIGKNISDPSLRKDLIEIGGEDGAMLISPNQEILKKNVLFFDIGSKYDSKRGLNSTELRGRYGFKDPSVNCRHFAALMISRYIPGPVVTWSETGFFRSYKNGEIIMSTFEGEKNENPRSYLLDQTRDNLEEVCGLYKDKMKSEIGRIITHLKTDSPLDKKDENSLKEQIYGLRGQYGHRPAYIFAVSNGNPDEYKDHIFNGSSSRECIGMNIKEDGFSEHFSKIGGEDGACITDQKGNLLMTNTQFINLSTGYLPEGLKNGARTAKSWAFAAATGLPVIILKESGEIKRFGGQKEIPYSLTLSDKPNQNIRGTPSGYLAQ
ncbi:hypothetical protein ISS05_01835 [Candidatus Woesearchaeota archaeon]|nr:hypothetical protein [Candidatus Woesearchaeota archaeon]